MNAQLNQQLGTEFKREQRYYVLKLSDLQGTISFADLLYLYEISRKVADRRAQEGKEQREYLVLEGDWPEYEPTWQAIEARVSGAPHLQQADGEPQRIFLVPTGEIYEGEETYQRYEGSPPPLCDYEVLYTSQPAPEPNAEPEHHRQAWAALTEACQHVAAGGGSATDLARAIDRFSDVLMGEAEPACIKENEKDCATCAHQHLPAYATKCQQCNRLATGARRNWEPNAEPVPMSDQQREWFQAGYEACERDASVCQQPPTGWSCTRKAGHDGPCAAVENDDAALVAKGMDRLRDAKQVTPDQVKAQEGN